MIDGPPSPLELRSVQSIPWRDQPPAGISLDRVLYGVDIAGPGMQIAIAYATGRPTRSVLRSLWEARGGRHGADVAVAVAHGDRVTVFGPDADAQQIELPVRRALHVLQGVLDEPDLLGAYDRFGGLRRAQASSGIDGVTNAGLFAKHYLDVRVPERPDWAAAGEAASSLLGLRGTDLITALGFTIRREGDALLLSGATAAPRAVAVLLDETESFDSPSPRHQLSPVAFGLREATDHDVDWLVVLRDERIRLYPGKTGVGVGQKGQTETYFEVDLTAVDEDHAALLSLVFSASALERDGSTQQILDGSGRYSTDLGFRLRDRIYRDVVPDLAAAVAERLPDMGLAVNDEGLRTAYRITLRILFRLLFQAYAEDRGLLPAGRNERYDANSLKTAAIRDRDTDPAAFGESDTLWADLEQVWGAIDKGNEQWMVPPYNGGLFSRDRGEGAQIAKIRLPDSVVGPVLQALLLDVVEGTVRGPVDFSSLSVREFGTIYEGLLESSLSLAETDLVVDGTGSYVPAADGEPPLVLAGSAYFHSASGERKATGSYFTPKIVVDHLIERSIVPVLQRHLDRIAALLESGDEVAAGREFFDFRVADLAMGSGHFLVAAIDRVEAMYRDFLTEHDVPRVSGELLRVAQTAKQALGKDAVAQGMVENVTLLRRQVARRCIYGIDVNPLARELARLALWIHTFVPGLPMSSFDHNLVCANSLTGIGTEEEAKAALEPNRDPGQASFLDDVIDGALAAGKTLLLDAANADEADKAGVAEGARLRQEARERLEPLRRVFDLAVAIRTGDVKPILALDAEALDEAASMPEVAACAERLDPAHMPYLFPEVFLRDRPGFDVLVGNPPWEKIKVETDQWWGLRIPKLRSMPQAQKNLAIAQARQDRPDLAAQLDRDVAATEAYRRVVVRGPFPGLGSGGDPDLYQAFAWRYWQLIRRDGRDGVVLPRGAMSGSALQSWRRQVLRDGGFTEVTFLANGGGWVFPGVHNSYTVALITAERGRTGAVRFAGPFSSEREFVDGRDRVAAVACEEFASWSSTAAFPLLPGPKSAEVFIALKRAPRWTDSSLPFEYRATTDFHSSGDKDLWQFDDARTPGRVPVLTGGSFRAWAPDYGAPYAHAESAEVRERMRTKLLRQRSLQRSAYYALPLGDQLPYESARLAFRDVTRATDQRTVIPALVPPGSVATEKAPVLVRRRGDARTDAYVVGVMSSIPFDWQLRRWVELKLSYEILYASALPASGQSSIESRVIEVAGRLAAVDGRYREWADEVGVPVGSVTDPVEKQDLIDELDALVSLLYGLSEDQVEHIFSTFHRGWDYMPRLEAVLHHYAAWKHSA